MIGLFASISYGWAGPGFGALVDVNFIHWIFALPLYYDSADGRPFSLHGVCLHKLAGAGLIVECVLFVLCHPGSLT